jgi:energy-coupling factor transporter ATP-binding protein EcfA2
MDPTREEYLAVVSEWSGYGAQSANLVGNAYPVFCITRGEVVDRPIEQFPNPGYIFLVNRGELTAWDFVRIRPGLNKKYKNASLRECYYISMSTPQVLEGFTADLPVAILIEVANFDPQTSSSLIRNPSQGVTPIFFVRNVQQRIYGPLLRTQVTRSRMDTIDAIQWEPCGKEGIIHEFSLDDLKRHGIQLLNYEHPERELNQVVEQPFTLLTGPVATATSSKSFDRIPDAQLAEWYLRWKDMPEVPEELTQVFRKAPDQLEGIPSNIIRQRCKRLATLFTTLEVLQTERRVAARRFLETEEGKKALEQQLALEVGKRAQTLEDEVKKRRTELAAEEKRLASQLEELARQRTAREQSLNEEMKHLEQEREHLTDILEKLQTQIRFGVDEMADKVREHVPLLAALSTGLRAATPLGRPGDREARRPGDREGGASAVSPSALEGAPWSDVRPIPPTKELGDTRDESVLIDHLVAELAANQLSFTRDFVANLYVSLKSNPLNLITGPPGHGKSSVVAALARALGHGNALLEIAVRRSWSDDRYLLGFFDTFHGRYDPGPTGLATRLLQAQYDWEQGGDGLYLVMLDEFNLAAPEYYFSQLLQILPRTAAPGPAPRSVAPQRDGQAKKSQPAEAEPRVLRLYDPAGHESRGGTHQIVLYPNVVFWGTINYDETTERLSPRLLDRTGMIFLTARDVSRSLTVAEARAQIALKAVRARQLMQEFTRSAEQCPEELWDRIDPLLEVLRRQTDALGSGMDLSPRVIENIKRYLANAQGVLSAARAVDFVFQQRVLPVLRGRGPKFAARMQVLRDRLTKDGLDRSARHVSDAIALADVNFGDIDFFGY